MGSFPWAPTPSNLGIKGPVPLWGPQERPGFAVPGAGWRRDAGASPHSLGRLRGRGAAAAVLSHPACPAGTWWPGLTHRQRPLPRCPAPRVWRPYTPGARPLPPVRPCRPARPARLPGRGSAGPTRADGPAGGKFLHGKRRGGAGRGAGRRGGKGPGEEGESASGGEEGSKVCGASAPPQETAGEAGCRDPPPGY